MKFLTETGMNLYELINMREERFSDIYEKIFGATNTHEFGDILRQIKGEYSKSSCKVGKNTIGYAMLYMREEILEDLLPNKFYSKQISNDLFVSRRCYPFEKKDFSLCQLALEKKWEGELDIKLQRFLPESLSDDEKQRCAKLLRQLRNKIAHGDFVTFEEKIEEYAVQFLDGKFVFDYSEYSRKNWTIGHICCLLDDILRRIFYMMFYDYRTLESIKKG